MALTTGQRKAELGILEAFDDALVQDYEGTIKRGTPRTVVLKGAAGTGKTYLLKRVMESLSVKPVLCALTHKAAAVMSKETGTDTHTLAKILKQQKIDDLNTGLTHFKSDARKISLDSYILFIDEVSMLNESNFRTLEQLILPYYHVLLIGDKFQLPPVGENESLAFTQDFESYELTEPCRTEAGNGIDRTAISIRTALQECRQMEGMKDILENHDEVVWMPKQDAVPLMVDSFEEAENADSVRVLSFTNNQVHNYNNYIKRVLKRDAERFAEGDMIIANSAYSPEENTTGILTSVNNNHSMMVDYVKTKTLRLGNIGGNVVPADPCNVECWFLGTKERIELLVPKDTKEVELQVAMNKEKALSHPKGSPARRTYFKRMFQYLNNFADVRPNYAQTVHKSQGSTYQTCFFDLNNLDKGTHYGKQLLYTGVTRAAKKLVLFK